MKRGLTLRPLGLGEVLDRAVTLCVTHFVPLASIFVVYAVPLAILQYASGRDTEHVMSVLASIAKTSGKGHADPTAIANALASAPPVGVWTPLFVLAGLVIGPLPMAALITACDAFYFGRPMSAREAYAIALRRWLPLLGTDLMYVVAAMMLVAAITIGGVVLAFALSLLTLALHAVGVAIAIVVGVLALVVVIAFFVVATLAIQISSFTCVIENENSIVSFARGIGRVFAGTGLRRSLPFGIAYAVIAIGIALVTIAGQALVVGLVHNTVAATAYGTLVQVATAAFLTAFVAIFYYDLRVREEGLDLTLAADLARDASTATA